MGDAVDGVSADWTIHTRDADHEKWWRRWQAHHELSDTWTECMHPKEPGLLLLMWCPGACPSLRLNGLSTACPLLSHSSKCKVRMPYSQQVGCSTTLGSVGTGLTVCPRRAPCEGLTIVLQ